MILLIATKESDEDGGHIATVRDLTAHLRYGSPLGNASAFGETPLKAMSELCIALKLLIDVEIEDLAV